jgi:hypothetical protein
MSRVRNRVRTRVKSRVMSRVMSRIRPMVRVRSTLLKTGGHSHLMCDQKYAVLV